MDLQLVTRNDYNVGTWLGIVNACSLLTSFGWILVAKRACLYDCFLAFLCTGHLAIVAPAMYISSVYLESKMFALSTNAHALLSNFLFVATGLMLVGKDAVTCRERIAAISLLYLFLAFIGIASDIATNEDGSSDPPLASDVIMWMEPIANSLCIMWFVLASVYRYSCLCIDTQQYMVISKFKAIALQVTVTSAVFIEKTAMYITITHNGDIIWWRIAHWGRTLACQVITYLLTKRNSRSQVTFNP